MRVEHKKCCLLCTLTTIKVYGCYAVKIYKYFKSRGTVKSGAH